MTLIALPKGSKWWSLHSLRSATLIVVTLVALLPRSAWAIEKASEQVTSFFGTFSYDIGIEAPPFRGLEPSLALTYSSEGANGFLGVGWNLTGFSTIERANPGRGTPLFAPSDIFLLDGEELVPCLPGSASPSCTSGGTHTTKLERYLRIEYVAGTNSFKVWGKDGTRSDYAPTLSVPAGLYTPGGVLRWGLSSVTDTSGNQVAYSWTCLDGDCYPEAVTYGGYSITFYRESRPDRLSFAASSILSETRYRLRSIIVRFGSSYVRGYKLAYGVSPLTGRSLLASAQLFGKDLVQDGNGLISSGLSLPAVTFSYQNDTLGNRFQDWVAPPTRQVVTEPVTWTNQVNVAPTGTGSSLTKVVGGQNWDAGATSTRAIVSGDGYVQFTSSQPTVAGKAVGLSMGNTNSSLSDIDYAIGFSTDGGIWAAEGGATYSLGTSVAGDILRVEVAVGIVYYKKNGVTLRQSTVPPVYPLRVDASILGVNDTIQNVTVSGAMQYVDAWCQAILLSGDFNGDQRTDQLCYTTTGSPSASVALAGASGFTLPGVWLTGHPLTHPIIADFDNDGKADLATHDPWNGVFMVAKSTGTGFAAPVSWGTAAATGPSGAYLCGGEFPSTAGPGDFNGDGLMDVYCKSSARPENFVGLSNGSSFTFAVWGQLGCDTFDSEVGAIDFDGNGMDDWYCIGSENDVFSVFTSNGSSFLYPAFGALEGSFCGGDDYVLGDLNGDGRTDASCRSNGKVALSTGRSFLYQGSYNGWCTGAVDRFATDVDGDGTSELICNAPGAAASDIQVRRWNGTGLGPAESWKDNWCSGRVHVGDWNGDGKSDLYCSSTASPAVAGTGGHQSDLISQIANGSGGTVFVGYSPSSIFTHTNNPPVKQTVTSVTSDDGRGWASTTTYAYSGGLMNRHERRFLGFRYARTNLPCIAGEASCPFSETWFRQDLAAAGSPETILRKDGVGNVLSKQSFGYTVNDTSIPRTSLLTSETNYSYDGAGCAVVPCASEKQSTVAHEYNAYGDRTRSTFQGDAAPGDEKSVVWTYQINGTAHIVALAQEEHFDHQGLRVAATRYGYDGQEWTLPPIKGRRTSSEAYLDRENRWIPSYATYEEPWGNQTSVKDPTNRVTSVGYDPAYHLFPQTLTNAALETETTLWDPICSTPTQHTDANEAVTTYQHDALCRLSRTDTPLGGFELRHYRDWQSATMRRVVVETPASTSATLIYNATHLDGLGRPWMTVSKGPTPHAIVSRVGHNGRGGVEWRTAPYYANEPSYATRYSYDGLDRLTLLTHEDGTSISRSYGAWSQATTDEQGTQETVRFDAYGRGIITERASAGQMVRTESKYDSLGRLTQLLDPQDITWTWKYDSLGRNYEANDPDAGLRTSTFDDAGRRLSSTDAENQRVELAYNSGGRLATKKTYTSANVLTGTTTLSYSEARSGELNVGRTTSVTGPGATSLQAGYDARGRLIRQKRTLDGVVYEGYRTFDIADRLVSIQYPDGEVVGPMSYDDAGRVKAIPGIVTELLYDASGRMTKQTNNNGTVTTRAFNPERGFLEHIETGNSQDFKAIQDLTYGYLPTGRLETITSGGVTGESWTYSYDDLYRLATATNVDTPSLSQSWTHDISGRMTYNSRVGTYTYPPIGSPRPHAPLSTGPDSFLYRPNGSMSSGAGRVFTWNVAGYPTQINTTQFVYGGLDERVKKVEGGTTSLYPMGDDYEIVNGVVTKYITAPGIGVLAKRTNTSLCPPTGTCWVHVDHQGSMNVETDGNGIIVQRRKFMAYGEKISDSTPHPESLGWIGERLDASTGLLYLHARYYDPARALFASPDPIGPAGGLNAYAYALGDPVNGSDPSGLAPNPNVNLYICYPWCPGGNAPRVVFRTGPGSNPSGGRPAVSINGQFIADWLNNILGTIFGGRRHPPNPNRRPGQSPHQHPAPGQNCTGPNCGAVRRGPQPQPAPGPGTPQAGTPTPEPQPAPPPASTPGPNGPAPTPQTPGPVPVPTPPGTGAPAPAPAAPDIPTGPWGTRIPQGIDKLNPIYQYHYFDWAYRRPGHFRFPRGRNDFMRHCTMTCEVSRDYGSRVGQLIGFLNEIDGFLSIDIERANPDSTPATAVQLDDLLANEFGRAFTGMEDVPCEVSCRTAPRP